MTDIINPFDQQPVRQSINITFDLPDVIRLLTAQIRAIKSGPGSQERAQIVIKLLEARMWANEALITEQQALLAQQKAANANGEPS